MLQTKDTDVTSKFATTKKPVKNYDSFLTFGKCAKKGGKATKHERLQQNISGTDGIKWLRVAILMISQRETNETAVRYH